MELPWLALRRRFLLDASKYGTPDRMSRFSERELEAGIGLECLAEFGLTCLFAAGCACNEGQILVGVGAVSRRRQAVVQRGAELAGGNLIFGFLVALDGPLQILLGLGEPRIARARLLYARRGHRCLLHAR